MSGGNIKVVVRCRPPNNREIMRGARGLIRMEGSQTILDPPEIQAGSGKATEKKPMVFSFDKSYWSAGPRDEPNYASQQTLYEDLGVELLDHSFEGFNTCIFAYGQTGSGKSYSMMGYGADKGIIPLTTLELFNRVQSRTNAQANLSYTVEVSYIEIYNEKVRDLLNPRNKGNLRVREHPSLGPYVEDLSRLVVEDYGQMMTLMDEGNKARTVASTNMNETSSRSHAVFTVILTQKRHDPTTNMIGEKVSKISLVDLAGSERQASTGATGTRLKEGANINKSLTTLGKVIAALASASNDKKKKKDDFVPYRDSVLTWLLKESLGGNSKTAMIAAISPADYEETLSTLRYADAAKKIKTHAVVNEDPNAKLIRELKEELELLRTRVSTSASDEAAYDPDVPPEKQMVTFRTKGGEIRKVSKLELQDQLQASEKLMESLNQTWEEKMKQTRTIQVEREKALEEMGISIDKDMVGVHAPQKHPSLVNLNEDPLMSECLVYQLKPGTTIAGSPETPSAQIRLSGEHILPEHCSFINEDGAVSVTAKDGARMFVNGKRIPADTPVKLLNGFRVILGDFHVFRFNDPATVRKERQKMASSASMDALSGEHFPLNRVDSPGLSGEMMDWNAAKREMANIEKMGDQDLDKLFDDIMKVRTQRGKRPESRHDMAADLESRFQTPSQTEETYDTLGIPWAGPMETTMTTNSLGTPQKPDEAEAEISMVESVEPNSPSWEQRAEDKALEQQHLTQQLRSLAQEVKRIRSQAAKARALEDGSVEPADWSARELRLVKWAVGKWKRLRGFSIAEQILSGAVSMREANVIAKQTGKRVVYNYLISETAMPTSSLDGLSGVVEFEDVSGSGTAEQGSRLLVKVIDRAAMAVYTWDYQQFTSQLVRMRQVQANRNKPGYALHFKVDEPFMDDPAPSFSFIGSAKVSLRLLVNRISSSVSVPIMCPYTAEAIGSCRIDMRIPVREDSSSGISTPNSTSGLLADPVIPGTRLVISLTVDAVRGISSSDFGSVHAQTRLTSLLGPSVVLEDTFASMPVDLGRTSITTLSLRKTISVNITSAILQHLRSELASIDFFAKVTPEYMDRLERWDRTRENSSAIASMPSTPSKSGQTRPGMRRNETDFIAPEHHDILATVEILEMNIAGEYAPADVIDDIFQLHQGLQRRISIRLQHTSGRGFPWTRFSHVSTSDIRLLTKSGITESISKPEVEVRVTSAVDFASDGTSSLTATGTWDTASHEIVHLNRKTPADQQILLRLIMIIDVDNLDEPPTLSLDLPIRILDRDARRSSFKFWSSSKVYPSLTAIFALRLTPPLAQSASDLWRLDTARKHVRGEEVLGDWRPRSLSLLDDHEGLKGTSRRMADVQATKAVLDIMRDVEGTRAAGKEELEVLMRCVELWRKAVDQRVKVDIKRNTPEEAEVARKLRTMLPDLEPKLVPSVTKVDKSDSLIKAGLLMILRDSQTNTWEKMSFALRRPYLLLHPSPNHREIQIINLTQAHAVPSPDVEQLLERRFAFTIFTPTNSFILQAPNQKEMTEWISVISATSEA